MGGTIPPRARSSTSATGFAGRLEPCQLDRKAHSSQNRLRKPCKVEGIPAALWRSWARSRPARPARPARIGS